MARFFPVLALYCAHLRVHAGTVSWISITVSSINGEGCDRATEKFEVPEDIENSQALRDFPGKLENFEFTLIPKDMKLRLNKETELMSTNSTDFWERCCSNGAETQSVPGCYSIQTSSVTISRSVKKEPIEEGNFKFTSNGKNDDCSPCKPASAETVSKPVSTKPASAKTKTSTQNSVKGRKAKGMSKTPKPANVTEEEESVHPGLFGKLKKPENLVACGLIILTFLYASVGWIVNYLL